MEGIFNNEPFAEDTDNGTLFYSGFVSLIGRPNVGKSTLMNRLVGEKIAIVTNKPQTTRNKVLSVLTRDDYQIVFIDTPGIHKPKSKLGEYMVKSAETALQEVDVTLYMIEPSERVGQDDLMIIDRLKKVDNVFLVVNKVDTVPREKLLGVIDSYRKLFDFAEVIPVSAARGDNVEELLRVIRRNLPEGPMYFPEDCVTDQPERQLAAELIREKLLQLMDEEIPHGTAVEVMSMKNRSDKDLVDIEATIYCEKDSHKGMIIGKRGAKLKEVGMRARGDIERLLGTPVNLQLWVKVKKDWRDSDFLLRSFGYDRGSLFR